MVDNTGVSSRYNIWTKDRVEMRNWILCILLLRCIFIRVMKIDGVWMESLRIKILTFNSQLLFLNLIDDPKFTADN